MNHFYCGMSLIGFSGYKLHRLFFAAEVGFQIVPVGPKVVDQTGIALACAT